MVQAGITISLQSGARTLRITRSESHWDVWLQATKDYSFGVFIRMYNNGRMERHHVNGEASYEVYLLKPADGEST